jgi:hypothetical protein
VLAAQFCVAAGAKLTPSVDKSNWYVIGPVPPEAELAVTVSVWPAFIGDVTAMSEGAVNALLTYTMSGADDCLFPVESITVRVTVHGSDSVGVNVTEFVVLDIDEHAGSKPLPTQI